MIQQNLLYLYKTGNYNSILFRRTETILKKFVKSYKEIFFFESYSLIYNKKGWNPYVSVFIQVSTFQFFLVEKLRKRFVNLDWYSRQTHIDIDSFPSFYSFRHMGIFSISFSIYNSLFRRNFYADIPKMYLWTNSYHFLSKLRSIWKWNSLKCWFVIYDGIVSDMDAWVWNTGNKFPSFKGNVPSLETSLI